MAAIFAAFSCVACGSIEVHQVLLRQPSMRPPPQIELYVMGGRPPSRPFYEVAFVQAIGHGSDADVEDVTQALANRGARLGCDAVVRVHVELGATRAHASGVCVNWATAPVKVEPAPAPTPARTETAPAPTSTPTSGGTSI